jgi:hypothetical protein
MRIRIRRHEDRLRGGPHRYTNLVGGLVAVAVASMVLVAGHLPAGGGGPRSVGADAAAVLAPDEVAVAAPDPTDQAAQAQDLVPDSGVPTTIGEIVVPEPANAPEHCRGEIDGAWLMNGITPVGLRLGLNECLRKWLAVGVVGSGTILTVLSNYLQPPWDTFASVVSDLVNGSTDAINYVITESCGEWAYLYVTWLPEAIWASCEPDNWGNAII